MRTALVRGTTVNAMIRPKAVAKTRRGFLGSTAAFCWAGLGRAADAPSLAISPVDAVTLQVVVDNATFGPFLPDQNLPGLKIIRSSGGSSGALMSRRPLLAEFGLSVLAQSRLGSATKRVLVDFGYSPEVIHNNLSLLEIDPRSLDASVLSHGHLDHYGGFRGLFAGLDSHRKLPLVVGGEEVFCERVAMIGTPPPLMGALDRGQLEKAGFDVRVRSNPQLLDGHAFTTGGIPLASFERAAIPTQMRPGVGCQANALSAAKRREKLIPDDGEHELATCLVINNLGLVVIASCSHRGVINSVRRAQEISGISKVHAVIGGFHLVRPRTEEEARQTVAEFAKIDPTYLIPMHCTGEVFTSEALRVMPQKVIRPYVGTKLVMGEA